MTERHAGSNDPTRRQDDSPLVSDSSPADGNIPKQINQYRIRRALGEGGMGTVYEAEQDSPRRTVALKVIRPGRFWKMRACQPGMN